ncbi:MAG: hypothetical protein IPG93_25940 [Burkholderiales bacterium]|nr:hypothetical protein [Burkholderiales bacterium]
MVHIVFTLDYEIHGNGEGCPRQLMIEPTSRLLRLLDDHGAKLTIMADVAEILQFRQYKLNHGHDTYHHDAIAAQLEGAVASGHDVQLHIHPSYFEARPEPGRWLQHWAEYDFARLPFERMNWMVNHCKQYLETLLQAVDRNYACIAFRAANWSVQPSPTVVRVLIANGLRIDSSIFKHGRRHGLVEFDYSHAHSDMIPWLVNPHDMCRHAADGSLWEVPIYCEQRYIGAFLTPARLRRVISGWRHKLERNGVVESSVDTPVQTSRARRRFSRLLTRHAWKADFNQCSAGQLIDALERARQRHDPDESRQVPFVMIGHSKLFDRQNESTVRRILAHASRYPQRYGYCALSNTPLQTANGVPP